MHLVISRHSDVVGFPKYQEVGISVLNGRNSILLLIFIKDLNIFDFALELTLKDDRIAKKTLLQRAWHEALRVEEMNPLVLVLYSPIEDRLIAKRCCLLSPLYFFPSDFANSLVENSVRKRGIGFWRALSSCV